MARDRDHAQVAARTRREGERLLRTAQRYLAAADALAAVRQCSSVWPNSVQDVAPTVCQKLEGHAPGEEDGGHRHRMLGTQVVVTW